MTPPVGRGRWRFAVVEAHREQPGMNDLAVVLASGARELRLSGLGLQLITNPVLDDVARRLGVSTAIVRERAGRLVNAGWLVLLRDEQRAPVWLLVEPEAAA